MTAVNPSLLIMIGFLHGAAYGVASTATGSIVARIIPEKRRGEGIVYPCLILFSVGMFLLGVADHGFVLLLPGAIIGLGYGNFLSCGQAIAIKGAPCIEREPHSNSSAGQRV